MGIREKIKKRRNDAMIKKFMKHLGVHKYEKFHFSNRSQEDVYKIRKEDGKTFFLVVLPDKKFTWMEMRFCELSD